MRPPITWVGGKHYMVKHLLPYTKTEHITYVEVFGGAGHLLFNKQRSNVEVYNDINSGVVTLYRVLRDKDKLSEFRELCELTPYSRDEYCSLREKFRNNDFKNDIEKAWCFFMLCSTGFGGKPLAGFGFNVIRARGGKPVVINKLLNILDRLDEIHNVLKCVQIEHNDFRKILKIYDRDTTLFYLDPPYIMDTRVGGKMYEHEMNNSDHVDLVNILLNIKGKAFLSCYYHDIYNPLIDAGWHRFDTIVFTYATNPSSTHNKRAMRNETILSNFKMEI